MPRRVRPAGAHRPLPADCPLSWVLQNESAPQGPGAAPGSSARLDITWVAACAYGWK